MHANKCFNEKIIFFFQVLNLSWFDYKIKKNYKI